MNITLQKLERLKVNKKQVFRIVLFLFLSLSIQQAEALNAGAVSIANMSGPKFVLSSTTPCTTGPRAAYVAYKICNTTGATLTNLSATLSGLASGFALSGGQPATQTIGSLTAGSCTTLFWFVSYPCTYNTATNISITVNDANPGTVAATNAVTTSSYQSGTNSIVKTITNGPSLVFGSTTFMEVEYNFTEIPKDGIAIIQPAGNTNFNAGCMKLTSVEVISSDIPPLMLPGLGNTLYFILPDKTGSGTKKVKFKFTFSIVCTAVATTAVPYAATSTGSVTTVKYNSNFGLVSTTFTLVDPCAGEIVPPVIASLPAPTTVNCPATLSFATATATDNCDLSVTLTYADVTTPSACPGNYSVTRTWTATDDRGNTATASQTIIVRDVTPPVIAALPVPTTVNCPATPSFAIATATDACDPSVTLTFTTNTTPSACPGNYTVIRTWTATDDCGNTATASQTIHVRDVMPPVIAALPAVSTINCPATPSFATATATDACDPSVTLSYADVITPSTCPGNYAVTRTWIAMDDCGNTATASQTINVRDETPPVIAALPEPSNIVSPNVPSFATATATDVCDASVTLTFADNTVVSACAGGYAIIRTWTAIDDCGNTATASQTINVNGDPNDFASIQVGKGIESTGDNWSASWGDYDNNGYPDLYVVTQNNNQPNRLYRNNGNGTFTDINTAPFSTDIASSLSSTWGDYDNDGDLDLYVANNIGYANFLYRNEGPDGAGGVVFTKILNDPIVSSTGYSHGVSWADYDNDGFLDMFVAVYWETAFNLLYHNNGDGTFSEVTNNAITNEASRSVSGAWGDYNNDGLLDLFVSNTGGQNNSLYQNLGGGKFERITSGAIVNDGGSSVSASWGDYDNDGDLDLYVTNAGGESCFLYKNNGDGTFSRITNGEIVTDTGDAHGSAWADWDNDGDLDLFVARDGRNNSLYRNDGNDVFTKIENDITDNTGNSFGSAWADYDRDGDLDLFVANRLGTGSYLYKNSAGTCNNWTSIKLVGTNSNKSAIGAKLYVTSTINGQVVTQMREISGQTGGGTGGQSDMTQIFGLNDATVISSILIEWPSGFEQVISNQPINQFLQFTEVDGAEICGTLYNDANGNCQQDVGEYGISGRKIQLSPGDIAAYTDDNGNYSVNLRTGTYTLQAMPSGIWEVDCPNATGIITVNASNLGGTYCGNNFGATALSNLPDLFTELAISAHRIASNNLMLVNYENRGAMPSTATILQITIPSEIEILLTSIPQLQAKSQTITFDLGTLDPNEKGTVFLSYDVGIGTPVGKILNVSSSISNANSDFNTSNNLSNDNTPVVAAYDPNDIAVSPARYVKKGEWLQYKIRFQNVGNIPAAQVRVEDQLPEGLDLSTIELGSTSHTYKFQLDGRKLVWRFPNINLADSLSNEKESHGFITFRIKPKDDLSIGDRLLNRAAIYFDNLEPVITNTVENVLTDEIAKESKALAKPLQIQPNPSSGKVLVQSFDMSLEPDAFFVEIRVFDQYGRQAYESQVVANQRQELYLFHLTSGTYHVKALDSKGRAYYGKLVMMKE